MQYDEQASLFAWSRMPIDDLGYFSAEELLILGNEQRGMLINYAAGVRYSEIGWRNRGNCLVDFAKPDEWKGKRVLDYGCGFGIDSILFARSGANVTCADLYPASILVASQNAAICGQILECMLTSIQFPFFLRTGFDLFWSFGVLHHTPHIGAILRRACGALNPGGECRIAVYSDVRFKQMAKKEENEETAAETFAGKCDSVGNYADWYDEEKLRNVVADFATVETKYICNDQMLAAVIRPKNS